MTRVLWWELKRHWRDYYPNVGSYLIELFSIFIGITVYWYTSKAFMPKVSILLPNQDFFTFVLIGELTMMIPAAMLVGPLRILNRACAENTFEPSLLLARPLAVHVAIATMALLPIFLLRYFVTLFLAKISFGIPLELGPLALTLLIQLLCWPLFLGLGLLSGAAYLRFGRGRSLLGHLETLLTILAGAYFPVQILPSTVRWFSELSPFTRMLDLTRLALGQTDSSGEIWPANLLILLAWLILSLPVGIICVSLAVDYRRHSGRKLPVAD